jgi:hypothetical protein
MGRRIVILITAAFVAVSTWGAGPAGDPERARRTSRSPSPARSST